MSTTVSPEPQLRKPDSAIRIVALTGFMGAGKTSVGSKLATLLHWASVDLDREIEVRQTLRIRDIFRSHGEPHFRQLETEILRDILAQISRPTVIALGGGTFIQPCNADLLRECGANVVFLDTPIEHLLQSCRPATEFPIENVRPLAADPDAFRALYGERLPKYRTANLTVNTSGKTMDEVAREIAARLQLLERSTPPT